MENEKNLTVGKVAFGQGSREPIINSKAQPEPIKCPECGGNIEPRIRALINEVVTEALVKMKDPPPQLIRHYLLTREKLATTNRIKSYAEAAALFRYRATKTGDYVVRQIIPSISSPGDLYIELLWRNKEAMDKGLALFDIFVDEVEK